MAKFPAFAPEQQFAGTLYAYTQSRVGCENTRVRELGGAKLMIERTKTDAARVLNTRRDAL